MNIKTLALSFFAVITTGSVVTIASVSNANSIFALASDCQHEGNHYGYRAPTKDVDGCKEYWVCCKCHEHWLNKPVKGVDPEYVWNEAIENDTYVTSGDDRFVASGSNLEDELKELGFSTVDVTYNDDETIASVSLSEYTGDSKTIIIPEGVTDLVGNVAKNKYAMEWIVVPSTIKNIEKSAFSSCKNLTLYFVGDTTLTTKDMNGVSALYKIQGTNWDYNSDGTPEAFKGADPNNGGKKK